MIFFSLEACYGGLFAICKSVIVKKLVPYITASNKIVLPSA